MQSSRHYLYSNIKGPPKQYTSITITTATISHFLYAHYIINLTIIPVSKSEQEPYRY